MSKYLCTCECGCEQGYDYEFTICSECQDGTKHTACVELSDHEWITDNDDDQKEVTWCDKCGEFWSDKFYDDSGDADSDNDLWDGLMGDV